ncbi:unnamed protein product [Prunus armeniaca]
MARKWSKPRVLLLLKHLTRPSPLSVPRLHHLRCEHVGTCQPPTVEATRCELMRPLADPNVSCHSMRRMLSQPPIATSHPLKYTPFKIWRQRLKEDLINWELRGCINQLDLH